MSPFLNELKLLLVFYFTSSFLELLPLRTM